MAEIILSGIAGIAIVFVIMCVQLINGDLL